MGDCKKVIKKLWFILRRRDKQFLLFLLLFSLLISIIETVGISAIMPFIAVASDFSSIRNNEYYKYIYELLGFTEEHRFVVSFGLILILFYILRSAINLYYVFMLSKFSEGRYYVIAQRLFENYLGMSYTNFVKKNSSTLTKTIINEAQNLTSLIHSVLFMMSEIFVIIFIYSVMMYVSWKITFVLSMALVLNAAILVNTVSKNIKKAGAKRERMQNNFYEIINRTFKNYKLIKLTMNDKNMLSSFSASSYGFIKANIKNATLSQIPRLFLEAIGFGIVVSIVTYLVFKNESDIAGAIGLLSMFVLGLYRLLPSVSRIFNGYNQIMFHYKSLDIIHNDLIYDNEKLGNEKIEFHKNIKLSNVSFEYEKNKPILKSVNLEIKKAKKIAFVGESGSGKTTLADIIMGLYRVKSGTVSVDGQRLNEVNIKNWRKKIGYIPQDVYLFDGSVKENVAFGVPFDKKRIVQVLKQAKIYDFLQTKEGIDTTVGEGGIMLSGGQKQRIAIARALYRDPEILVLDEATSALDSRVEEEIMNEIYEISEKKTLIIIAHRVSTTEKCDKIYKIDNGDIT